jgi:hypothetical protein
MRFRTQLRGDYALTKSFLPEQTVATAARPDATGFANRARRQKEVFSWTPQQQQGHGAHTNDNAFASRATNLIWTRNHLSAVAPAESILFSLFYYTNSVTKCSACSVSLIAPRTTPTEKWRERDASREKLIQCTNSDLFLLGTSVVKVLVLKAEL